MPLTGAERTEKYRAENREKVNEAARKYRAANREKVNDAARKYRQAHPDRTRESHRKNYYKDVEYTREQARQAVRRRAHGPLVDVWFARAWESQQGCCYLCEEALDPDGMIHIDHDHNCCPPRKSCDNCRRGLACPRCNHVIGKAKDDPDLLRRIADNLAKRS
jgi:Recombination endonuclease VII